MIYINLSLALACFVIVPAMVIVSKIFANYMQKLSTETQDRLADANATAEEVISAIPTMRAFAAEGEELQRYEKGMTKYVDTAWRQARLYYFYSSITFTFLPYITYCIILFFAAQLIHVPVGCVNPSTTTCPSPPALPFAPPYPPSAPPPPHSPGYEDPPLCGINGASLVSFVFYMNALFAAFQSLINIFSSLAQVRSISRHLPAISLSSPHHHPAFSRRPITVSSSFTRRPSAPPRRSSNGFIASRASSPHGAPSPPPDAAATSSSST